jgi:hypothetical protein
MDSCLSFVRRRIYAPNIHASRGDVQEHPGEIFFFVV